MLAATLFFFVALKALYVGMMVGNVVLWGGVFGAFKDASDVVGHMMLGFVHCSAIFGGGAAAGAYLARKKSLFLVPLALLLTILPPDSMEIFKWMFANA